MSLFNPSSFSVYPEKESGGFISVLFVSTAVKAA